MSFQSIEPCALRESPFSAFYDGMLLTAGDQSSLNTMTCGWGQMGTLWRVPVATCYVRPQRYTYEFMQKQPFFTLGFYDASYKEKIMLCGTKSGRDIDKVAACGFTTAFAACGAPYFEEARLVLVCRKIYTTTLTPEGFTGSFNYEKIYPEKDYHRVYVGEVIEILECLKKD